jgi:hypothetical protein
MPLLDLPQIHVSGDAVALGRGQGEQLKERIGDFVSQRLRAARAYLFERGIRDEQAFRALGAACLAALKEWDGPGWIEHQALAAGAGVDAVDLYTTANMTDIRDILALPARAAEAEGCSTALVPATHAADGAVHAAQSWDLNPGDLDFVVAVHRRPDAGPETWSITCAGCPSLIGMNAHGVAVGTTNIKTRGSRVGIPYLSLLHRPRRESDRAAAGRVFTGSPRAAAHTYWAADAGGIDDWECTADSAVHRAGDRPLYRTNHCLDEAHRAREGEPASPSSRARLARLGTLLDGGGQDVASLKRLFADRADGSDSINRFAEDGQGTSTNACMVTVPARRELWACRGSADRGAWTRLAFAS